MPVAPTKFASALIVSSSAAGSRMGDSTTSSSKGLPLPVATPVAVSVSPSRIILSAYHFYGASATVIDILYEDV